jgi:hypothetical protein
MSLKLGFAGSVAAAAILFSSTHGFAHVGIPGPAFAGTNQILTFTVGHGCEGSDTARIEIQIPPEVTTVRGLPGFFGLADVKTNEAGVVTSVVFTKDLVRPADDQFYELKIRIKVPETPFETLYFPTLQYCRTAEGVDVGPSRWTKTPANPEEVGAEESPHVLVLPPRMPGWNKITAPKNITDLTVFDDAQIVWVGESAYSSNPTTVEQIAAEAGVTPLAAITAGAEIWVKY